MKTDADAIQTATANSVDSIGCIYRLPNELLHPVFTFLFLSEDASVPYHPPPVTVVVAELVLVGHHWD